jgi:hypothetical protein
VSQPTIPEPGQRLRTAWVLTIVFLTISIGYSIHRAQPTYQESATVLFMQPGPQGYASQSSSVAPTLITTGEAVSLLLMSPQAQDQIQDSGGIADCNLTLINFYNQDYPEYSYPEATLTASSLDPASVHWTFLVAERTMTRILNTRQEQAGVPPGDRIATKLIGDSGPIVLANSRKRAFAGLALLAVVIGSSGWAALGRRYFAVGRGKHSLE